MNMKHCPNCNQDRPNTPRYWRRYRTVCRVCLSVYHADWRKRELERTAAQRRAARERAVQVVKEFRLNLGVRTDE